MRMRRVMIGGVVMSVVSLITAGVIFAAGIGSVNQGTDSSAESDYSTIGGGRDNEVVPGSADSTISGGSGNFILEESPGAVIAGGVRNAILSSSSRSVIGGGIDNSILNPENVIGGGRNNHISSDLSVIGGGWNNTTGPGGTLTIGGGRNNTASGNDVFEATIGGGGDNSAIASGTTIGGGRNNTVSGENSTIGGGESNKAVGPHSTIGGGGDNTAGLPEASNPAINGEYSTVGGGKSNWASNEYTTIAGGRENTAHGWGSAVGGGDGNCACAEQFATIGGGDHNTIGSESYYATIGGGNGNIAGGSESDAQGSGATVPGGIRNKATGFVSFAAGYQAQALHDGAFVWADSTDAPVSSERDNEFVIRATGGVRIITGEGRGIELNGQDILELIQDLEARIEALENPGPSPEPPPPAPLRMLIEAEDGSLDWPIVKNSDSNASGGQYISATSGRNVFSPREEASYEFSVPEDGTYWLWARLYGPDEDSDAIYIGIDGSWDRVYPAEQGQYLWTRVGPERSSSGKYGVSLSKGTHEIQVGHAELYARLDALFVTDDWDTRP